MRTDKPAWLSDDSLSLAKKKQRLKQEYPHIVRQLRNEVEREMRRRFHEKHKGSEELVKTKVKVLAGI